MLHPADRRRDMRLNAGTLGRFTRLPAMTDLVDGDTLPVLGGLRVIHTPGHTPRSVSLFAEDPGILNCGDALWRDRAGRLHRPSPYWSEDLATARTSVARLARLDVSTILFAHLPPLPGGGRALRELGERWH